MTRITLLVTALVASCSYSMQAYGTCHQKYTAASPSHSQCITTTGEGFVSEHPPSQSEINDIVNEHNAVRSEANATNMMRMKWNDEIASSAQKMASSCAFYHDTSEQRREPGKYSVGQNIAMGSVGYYSNWGQVVRKWASEIDEFNADRTYSSAAGHYSAIVWASTSLVGCGRAKCEKYGWTWDVYYCNYAPSGNMMGVEAYSVDGAPCSKCGSSRCEDNLCDCGSDNELNTCMNMGTLNLETCACSCRKSFYDKKKQCELTTCPSADSGGLCTYPAEYCGYYSNFPIDCPVLCDTCPWAHIYHQTNTT